MEFIKILTEQDTLVLENNTLMAKADGHEYAFPLESIMRLVIATMDSGPLFDDMGLIVQVGEDTSFLIMSEHKCYEPLLFQQLGKALPVDYQKIIEASSCTEQNYFEIYSKNPPDNGSENELAKATEAASDKSAAPRRGNRIIRWISDLFRRGK